MLPVVLPLSSQVIDWFGLIELMKQTIGPEPQRRVDELSVTPGSVIAYFDLLVYAFRNIDLNPNLVLRNGDDHLMRHLFFSFAAYHDEEEFAAAMLENSDLEVCSRDRLCVVTGSLDKWRDAVLVFCSEDQPFNLRVAFNYILLHFERGGLFEVWNSYGKHTLKDQSFVLRRK